MSIIKHRIELESLDTLTVGELLGELEQCDPDDEVTFDFCRAAPTHLSSSRGNYSELALGYECVGRRDEPPKVRELVKELKAAIGKDFTGWKGGEYTMYSETPVWVDNPGECSGTGIIDVRKGYRVILDTAHLSD